VFRPHDGKPKVSPRTLQREALPLACGMLVAIAGSQSPIVASRLFDRSSLYKPAISSRQSEFSQMVLHGLAGVQRFRVQITYDQLH
jgi:hypothetical protein